MKVARLSLVLIGLISAAYFVIARGPSLSRALPQAVGASGSCCGPEGPREVDFPYYNLTNGWISTLYLVSDSPNPIDLTLAIKGKLGQVLTAAQTIQPQQKLSLDLGSLITQLGGDPTAAFAEGSVSVYFTGTIMPVLGQITMRNPQLSLVNESVMVEHDPGRSDIPSVLNGLWWGLGGGRAANVMVSNTSPSAQTAQVYLEFGGKQYPLSTPLTFVPYETKVLDITQLLTSLGVDPAQVPEGGITIVQTGGNPALIANGRITDPASGFSSTIDFPSPEPRARQRPARERHPHRHPEHRFAFCGGGNLYAPRRGAESERFPAKRGRYAGIPAGCDRQRPGAPDARPSGGAGREALARYRPDPAGASDGGRLQHSGHLAGILDGPVHGSSPFLLGSHPI